MVFGSALASAPSKQSIWLQASSAPAMRLVATQASLRTKESKGRLERPQSFQFPDPVLHPGVSPVTELEGGDVGALRVGDEAGVAEALCRVEEGQLGPGVGTLSSHDQPGLLRPGGKRHQLGQFGDPGTVPDGAVGLFGRDPVLFLDEDQGVAYSLVCLLYTSD